MEITPNLDGSTTVTCEGQSVVIRPSMPAPPAGDDGGLSIPGTVSASLIARLHLGHLSPATLPELASRLRQSPKPAGDPALLLHVSGSIDLAAVRAALREAGMADLPIEIVPMTPRG
jgi:hypothetical protein